MLLFIHSHRYLLLWGCLGAVVYYLLWIKSCIISRYRNKFYNSFLHPLQYQITITYRNCWLSTYSLAYALVWCVDQIPQIRASTERKDLTGFSSQNLCGASLRPVIWARPNLWALHVCAISLFFVYFMTSCLCATIVISYLFSFDLTIHSQSYSCVYHYLFKM